MTQEMIFTRFERFWHWTQAFLIIFLMITGFEVNGAYVLYGYERAADLHRLAAWVLIWLWVFAIFWHLITGEWRQYIPTTDKLAAVVRYYTSDMFDPDASHPFKVGRLSKHNPLQRLAYLSFNVAITPVIWVSGLLYMYYNDWDAIGLGWMSLLWVAGIHTAASFAMLAFLIVHIYMVFMGRPILGHLKAMITGYEPETPDQT